MFLPGMYCTESDAAWTLGRSTTLLVAVARSSRALVASEAVRTARFDVYGRYEVDIERHGDRWVVYECGEGKRRERPDLAIPPDVTEEAMGGYLDDLLHEEGGPDLVVKRIR